MPPCSELPQFRLRDGSPTRPGRRRPDARGPLCPRLPAMCCRSRPNNRSPHPPFWPGWSGAGPFWNLSFPSHVRQERDACPLNRDVLSGVAARNRGSFPTFSSGRGVSDKSLPGVKDYLQGMQRPRHSCADGSAANLYDLRHDAHGNLLRGFSSNGQSDRRMYP